MKKKAVVLLSIAAVMAFLLAGCQNSGKAEEGTQPKTESTGSTSEAGTKGTVDTSGFITEEEAKKAALDDAGVAETDVANIRVQLDEDDGIWQYEVDFYAGDKEYDYDIGAEDGTIRSKDQDIDDDFGKRASGNAGVTEEEAKEIALAKVAGATDENIRIHLDSDDGKSVYEGSIIYNEREYDFEIDAETGSVMEWEEDSVYDD